MAAVISREPHLILLRSMGDVCENTAWEWCPRYAATGRLVRMNATLNLPEVEENGLTASQVRACEESGQTNAVKSTTSRSILDIVRANVFTLFNGIIFAAMVLVLITGSWKDAVFGFVILINTGIGIVTELKAKRTLDRLSILVTSDYAVRRDGENTEVPSRDIVLGDLLWIRSGEQVPADAQVLSSYGLELDESMLTGESRTVRKEDGDQVYSGSTAVSGVALARVNAVGEHSYAATLTAQAKVYKKTVSDLNKGINTILKFMTFLVVPLCVLLVWSQMRTVGGWNAAIASGEWRQAIVSAVAGVVGMIPEGLVLLTSLNFAVAAMRLARKNTLVQELESVETLARVDCLNLDKTGTITESTMQADDPLPLAENTPITEILSAFYAGGQPDNDTARALTARFGQGGTAWAAVRTIPFNTAYKYSAKDFGAQGCYVVGAPDVLAGSRAGELDDRLTPLLAQGRRVLLLAKYNGTLPDPPAALDSAQLEFLALLPLQNRIRESAPKTFRFFAKQGVKIKVISGDDPQAVSHVAANAGIDGAEHWVDAATLQSEAALAEAAEKCTVFGRVTPEQKRQLVHALQAKGHTVAMTGDGVNDVLALKDADCGIAMASGAQAASQVAQLVLLDSDFAALPGVVAEGRRVINNIQRSASLFLVKNIFSFLLSIVALALPLAYPFQPLQLSLVTFATIGAPAFFLALEPNHELVHGRFMRNVLRKALPGGLTDFLLVFCAQGFGYAFDIPSDMVGTICTLVILCVGLQILWGVCIPFTPLHWAIWGSMTVAGVGGVFLLARWLPLVRLDLGGTLVLVVLLALSAPTLAGLIFMGERLHGMVNDWKNKKARKHV